MGREDKLERTRVPMIDSELEKACNPCVLVVSRKRQLWAVRSGTVPNSHKALNLFSIKVLTLRKRGCVNNDRSYSVHVRRAGDLIARAENSSTIGSTP